jgi:2-oxoisovalerate dehydrogenase E1 component alpha subunit
MSQSVLTAGQRGIIDIAHTEVTSPIQLLTPGGVLLDSAEVSLDATPELCREFYRDMALARRLDQEAYSLQRQGELGLWLMALGQEASQVGSIRAVRDSDHVFPTYREHAAAFCRGITPSELLSQWRGTSHGSWDPAQYRFHIYSLVLAAQLPQATGYAMGVRADCSDEIVLAYLGDGASSQGDANEAFNWAAVMHAPMVFFCQNNQWAISTPSWRQHRSPLHERAAGFGLRSSVVDGNDVLAVHAVVRQAAAEVRNGGRPAFIEALTYRMSGHSTSDDPLRYRSQDELDSWARNDPLTRLRLLLDRHDWADRAFFDRLAQESDDLAADTRKACLALEPPSLTDTFRHTLTSETSMLRREREQFEKFMESFA